jgi:hypothetical protein
MYCVGADVCEIYLIIAPLAVPFLYDYPVCIKWRHNEHLTLVGGRAWGTPDARRR